MNTSNTNSIHAGFDRKMMEIGYIGAFYGMGRQARALFDLYADERHYAPSTQLAAKLGAALILIGEYKHQAAAQLLEKLIEDFGEDQVDEAKALLVLAYKKAKIRADRVDALLDEIKGAASESMADAVKTLAAF